MVEEPVSKTAGPNRLVGSIPTPSASYYDEDMWEVGSD